MSAVALARRARAAHAAADQQFGKYAIGEQLGVGGMATVHRATLRGRPVALKRLLPHLADDPQFLNAFVDEARLASYLHHPNIVETLDFGQVDGQYFLAMEFIAGPTLLQINKQCASAAGPMPLPIVINVLCQMLDGLDHAHNLRDPAGKPVCIIHRDVSPPNVVISNTGIVKLIDFGVAKVASSRRTKAGIVKGKLAYVAPEYTHGQLDSRADLFAVGVIAHELLVGKSLFQAETDWDTLMNVRQKVVTPPSRENPRVWRDLDDVVMTALQREPALRWQSAAAMRNALANLAADQSIVLSPGPVIEWVNWCFEQKPGANDSLARVIDALGEPSRLAPLPRKSSPPPPPPPRAKGSGDWSSARGSSADVSGARGSNVEVPAATVPAKKRGSVPPPLPAASRSSALPLASKASRSSALPPVAPVPAFAATTSPAKPSALRSGPSWRGSPVIPAPRAAVVPPKPKPGPARPVLPGKRYMRRASGTRSPMSTANRIGWMLLVAATVFLAAYYVALSRGV